MLIAGVLGAVMPLIWGLLGFLWFNLPEGPQSRAFWKAVYLTCPSWSIDGYFLTPLLNALMYTAIAAALILGFNLARNVLSRLN